MMKAKTIIARTIVGVTLAFFVVLLIKLMKWAIIPAVIFWLIFWWAVDNAFPSKK